MNGIAIDLSHAVRDDQNNAKYISEVLTTSATLRGAALFVTFKSITFVASPVNLRSRIGNNPAPAVELDELTKQHALRNDDRMNLMDKIEKRDCESRSHNGGGFVSDEIGQKIYVGHAVRDG